MWPTGFFESTRCVHCGAVLGFDPYSLEMRALRQSDATQFEDFDGQPYQLCRNTIDYQNCNWLLTAAEPEGLCRGCRFNRTIPNLNKTENHLRWKKIETAKKRLLYTLYSLNLPLQDGFSHPQAGLVFDFLEDHRSDPLLYPQQHALTGFQDGVITINVLEADDHVREALRLEMNEAYRTLLGHLRHESGHFYWPRVSGDSHQTAEFRAVFGDERDDYSVALERYYQRKPSQDWQQDYISEYASAHPLEDWAESWAHYLYIVDAMETAAAYFNGAFSSPQLDFDAWITTWGEVSIALNEMNRSSGLWDAYPFVLNDPALAKLRFVNQIVYPAV